MNVTDLMLQMALQTMHKPAGSQGTVQKPSQESARPEKSEFQSLLEGKREEITADPAKPQAQQDHTEEANPENAQVLAAALAAALQIQPQVISEETPVVVEQIVPTVPVAEGEVQTALPGEVVKGGEPLASMAQPETGVKLEPSAQQAQTAAEEADGGAEVQRSAPAPVQKETEQQPMEHRKDGPAPRESVKTETGETPVPVEQPLFRETTEMPVKVGEATELDATSKTFDAQAAKTIAEAMEKGFQRVELKLTPEHLGTVTVELTRSGDGAIRVVLWAESEHTLKLLNDHSAQLGSLLQSSVHSDVRVEVPRGQESQQPWQQPDQQQGGGQRQNQNSRQQEQPSSEDFLQQLRLGLLRMEEAV